MVCFTSPSSFPTNACSASSPPLRNSAMVALETLVFSPSSQVAGSASSAVSKALRDDYHRLGELERKKCGDPLSAAEVEEESKLRARIGDRARAACGECGYGLK